MQQAREDLVKGIISDEEFFDIIEECDFAEFEENEDEIEDYLNLRIKVEPLGDVRKAFIEIRNQLQVIKEVLE